MDTSIALRSARAFSWGMGGALGKIVGQLLVQITLARILDPVAFGQYAVVIAALGLAFTLADGGLSFALIQKEALHPGDISLALGRTLSFAAALALLTMLAAPFLARQFGDPALAALLRVCAILIPVQMVFNITSSLLRRELRMKGIQVINFVAYTVFFGGVAIPLSLMGWGVWSLVAGYFAQTIFSLFATYALSRHTLRPRLTGDRNLVHFGMRSLASEVTGWCMNNLDRFLVGRFWGIYSLGLYSVASNLSRAPSGLMVDTAQSIAFVGAARLQGDSAALRRGFLVALTAMALLTVPVFTLVAFDSATVLYIVYGAKWTWAAPCLTAFAASVPLAAMGSVSASIVRGTGNAGTELRIQVIAAVVLFSGFLIMQAEPLAIVVWVVPLAYLARLLLLLQVLRDRLALRVGDMLLAMRGALVLSAAGLGAAALVRTSPHAAALAMGAMPILGGCLAIVLLTASRSEWFLGVQLRGLVAATLAAARPPEADKGGRR